MFHSLPLTYGRSSPFFSFTSLSSIGCLILLWLLLCCKEQWISVSSLSSIARFYGSMILETSIVSRQVSHALLSHSLKKLCPTLTALLCQPFPSSATPLWMYRGQNCMRCSKKHHHRLFGSIIISSFCPLQPVPNKDLFFHFFCKLRWCHHGTVYCNTKMSFVKDCGNRPWDPPLNR